MTTLVTSQNFKQWDADGVPLASGKLYTYEVGTTTPKTTYQDRDKVAAHTNPIILDSWGEAEVWIDGDTKVVIQDSDGVTLRTFENIQDESSGSTVEFPVNPSPDGAVLRSSATETGYIKVRLPMGEWPNTKLMFDLLIYTDNADEALKITLGGFANSISSAWETTTAIIFGNTEYDVQFGNDGTYPAIYIGAVDSEWVKPQVAVVNFLAGEFSYDWSTWNNGWVVSVTTSLGTITGEPNVIVLNKFTENSEKLLNNETGVTPGTADIGHSYQGEQNYGRAASGLQTYGKGASGEQHYAQGATGAATFGRDSEDALEVGSTEGGHADKKLISVAKEATFEAIIDKSAEVTAGSYANATLETGWTSTTNVKYRKVMNDNFVHIVGNTLRGGAAANLSFTLPVGYRPTHEVRKDITQSGSGTTVVTQVSPETTTEIFERRFFQVTTAGAVNITSDAGETVYFDHLIHIT